MKVSTQFSVDGFTRASVLTVPIGPRPTRFFHFNLSPGRAISLLLSRENRKALDKDPYAFPMPISLGTYYTLNVCLGVDRTVQGGQRIGRPTQPKREKESQNGINRNFFKWDQDKRKTKGSYIRATAATL